LLKPPLLKAWHIKISIDGDITGKQRQIVYSLDMGALIAK
jgi:hypothetical protein